MLEIVVNTNTIDSLSNALFAICDYAECYTGKAIIKKTITVVVNNKNLNLLYLPYHPIMKIQSVSKKYKDTKEQYLQVPLDINCFTSYFKNYKNNLMDEEMLTVVYILLAILY